MAIVSGSEQHCFLGSDTAGENLLLFQEDGRVSWQYHTGLSVFDLWKLPQKNGVLFCHHGSESGVTAMGFDGEVLYRYRTQHEVFGCQPLENGNVLVGELRQKRLVEAAPDGSIEKEIPVRYDAENMHEVMRSVRKLHDGTYMMVSPGLKKIFRFDDIGHIVWQADTRPDTFAAVEKPNGNLVYSCMDGLGELDQNGKEVWALYPQDCPQINICWLLALQLRKNGNLVCCNWLGHGHDGEGIPMFEVTPNKKVVWQCDCRAEAANLGTFCLLGDAPEDEVCYRPLR